MGKLAAYLNAFGDTVKNLGSEIVVTGGVSAPHEVGSSSKRHSLNERNNGLLDRQMIKAMMLREPVS